MAANPYENLNAYGRNQNAQTIPTGNSRDTDARALLTSAGRMLDAKLLLASDLKSKDHLKTYGDAIRHNQRLWTIFQVALSDPEHPLPEHLKRILLNLCRYVDKTSFRAVGKYTPDLMDSLISINRRIASGLSKPMSQGQSTAMPSARVNEVPTSLVTSA